MDGEGEKGERLRMEGVDGKWEGRKDVCGIEISGEGEVVH